MLTTLSGSGSSRSTASPGSPRCVRGGHGHPLGERSWFDSRRQPALVGQARGPPRGSVRKAQARTFVNAPLSSPNGILVVLKGENLLKPKHFIPGVVVSRGGEKHVSFLKMLMCCKTIKTHTIYTIHRREDFYKFVSDGAQDETILIISHLPRWHPMKGFCDPICLPVCPPMLGFPLSEVPPH